MKKWWLWFLVTISLLYVANVSSLNCSLDVDCKKCGNNCVLTTESNGSCPAPTEYFNCTCIQGICTFVAQNAAGEENKTEDIKPEENKTEVLKSPLVDCSTNCKDSNGCVCPKDCEKTETVQGSNCGKKITAKPVVSLCEGCSTDDADNPCIEVGTQKQEADGTTFYCSSSKKIETAKEAGENCNNDYECLTYTCNEGVCFEEIAEEPGMKTSRIILIIGIVILFLGLTFLALKFLNTKKTVVKEEKKVEKKEFEIQEPGQKYAYQYRPEFDVLEKKLKESLGKVKK